MLTPRLECILKYVNCSVAADIGTDHAYIPIELIKRGAAERVIATDIRKGPLETAKNNIKENGASDKIETRLGGGLSVLKTGEADVIIIAGMGGELITDILKNDETTARAARLILQPMNAQYEIRRYLAENGYFIECEDLENEKQRIYNIMVVRNGSQTPPERDIEYHLPKYLYLHPKFHMLLEKKRREFKKIVLGLEKSKNCDIMKLQYYRKCLEETERI